MGKYIFIFLFLIKGTLFSQRIISGTVFDENNAPIPNAKIYIKNNSEQRTVADYNGKYQLQLMPGEYFLVIDFPGFELKEAYIAVSNTNLIKNIKLFPSKASDLQSVELSAKKYNPGRDIMLKVVEKRDQINLWNYKHDVDVYIKASEEITRKDRKKKSDDPLEEENNDWSDNFNFVEVQLNRSYAPVNKVKEVRNAYTVRGRDRFLFYTSTVKTNFNFFENLLQVNEIHENPIISPISAPGILSYKYRLEDKIVDSNRVISKIKIIPRQTATSTLEGYIYVVDSLWLIDKIELSLKKGNLKRYDYFSILQNFENVGDTLCLLDNQYFYYGGNYAGEKSTCTTEVIFSNYDFKVDFNKKYFSNELAVTTKEAYEKDTSYWKDNRKIILTEEEKRIIRAKDSIRDYKNRKEYLDSVDALFNKITPLKVLWFGIDHRNRSKKYQWTVGSIATIIQPMFIGGPRFTPNFDYFKKWKDERTLDSYTRISYGILNNDIKGDTWWKYRFDPFHQGFVRWSLNHDFDVIRGYDAITQIYKRDNFIEATRMSASIEYELFNGFYVDVRSEFSERRSLQGLNKVTFFDQWFPNNDFMDFDAYQAFVSDFTISYTPGQKYMREPYRKVVLGSVWPTFYLNYERGIPLLFGSDVDHEYIQFDIQQAFKIGTLGTSNYRFSVGKFLSTRNLYEPDYKFQRRSDPIWFSNPLYSFQGLDTLLRTTDYSTEIHFVHHDNSAIVNKIPFMKKTRIGLVLGAGALYVKEYNWLHTELMAGIERSFKISRRRLRIGIYGVVSDGNKSDFRADWKMSFAILNDRSMKWNF